MPVSYTLNANELLAQGELPLKQTDLGLAPFRRFLGHSRCRTRCSCSSGSWRALAELQAHGARCDARQLSSSRNRSSVPSGAARSALSVRAQSTRRITPRADREFAQLRKTLTHAVIAKHQQPAERRMRGWMKGDVQMIARQRKMRIGQIRLLDRDEPERLPKRLGRARNPLLGMLNSAK